MPCRYKSKLGTLLAAHPAVSGYLQSLTPFARRFAQDSLEQMKNKVEQWVGKVTINERAAAPYADDQGTLLTNGSLALTPDN